MLLGSSQAKKNSARSFKCIDWPLLLLEMSLYFMDNYLLAEMKRFWVQLNIFCAFLQNFQTIWSLNLKMQFFYTRIQLFKIHHLYKCRSYLNYFKINVSLCFQNLFPEYMFLYVAQAGSPSSSSSPSSHLYFLSCWDCKSMPSCLAVHTCLNKKKTFSYIGSKIRISIYLLMTVYIKAENI